MDYKRIANSIGSAIERRPTDIAAYTDLFSLLRSWEEVDFKEAHGRNKLLLNACAEKLREVSGKELEQFYGQWRKCLLFEAPHDLDSFLQYMELDRDAKKRFYQPRRRVLKRVVDDTNWQNSRPDSSTRYPERRGQSGMRRLRSVKLVGQQAG